MRLDEVQAMIDAKVYPPTMDYDIATLEPRGPLAERLRRILHACPAFFEGKRFLDVGCSKGFFSLSAARAGAFVLAIDPDQEALDAWRPACPFEVEQRCCTFGDLGQYSGVPFDRVWIGNGHHYLFREDPAWIDRLEVLVATGARVVIEGPVNATVCRDLRGFGAHQDEDQFLERMSKSFDLEIRVPSPSYTPGRAIWAFRTR